MNRNIILAIIAIIIIAVLGFFVFSQPATTDGKLNTEINIISGSTLHNGENVEFELKDSSGAAIPGQNVSIVYDDGSGNVQNYKVITDQNGKGYLAINGEQAGNYDITVTYDGNDKYNGCSAKCSLTIEDGATTEVEETTESNSTASTVMYNNETSGSAVQSENQGNAVQTYYDPELNVYYDANGIVIGGQEPGVSIYELRNRPPMQEEGT